MRLGILSVSIFASMILAGGRETPAQTRKIKAVVLTGQRSYPSAAFFGLFEGLTDIAYTHVDLPGQSEIFEDISKWDYDVIVMHNSGQDISEKRQANFLKLLDRGVGLVVVHHAVCAYEGWPSFRKIIGTKFYGVGILVGAEFDHGRAGACRGAGSGAMARLRTDCRTDHDDLGHPVPGRHGRSLHRGGLVCPVDRRGMGCVGSDRPGHAGRRIERGRRIEFAVAARPVVCLIGRRRGGARAPDIRGLLRGPLARPAS